MPTDTVLLAEAPATAHPLWATTTTERWLAGRAHRWLFPPGGDAAAAVDATWSVTGDVLTVALGRHEWSDGTPLTGADVCATLDRLGDPAHPTPWTGLVSAAVASCSADPANPGLAAITLRRRRADPRGWLAVPLMPAHRPDWLAWVPGSGPEPPFVGLGDPIRIDKRGWTVGGERPARLVVVDDPIGRFVAGEGTAVLVPDAAELPRLRALDGVTVDRYGPWAVWALVLDPTRPPFDDPALRDALDRGLDRAALAAARHGRDPSLDRQPWSVVPGPWPPGSPDAGPGERVPPHDPAAAARLAGVGGALAVPEPLPESARALLPFTPAVIEARAWVSSVLGGAHGGTSVAALAPLDGPPCAWFETRAADAGPRNLFGFSDPEVDAACRAIDAGTPEATWTLHALLADRRPAVFLYAHQGRLARRVSAAAR